jgi:hypothetical protein
VVNLNDCLTIGELIRSLLLVQRVAVLDGMIEIEGDSAHLFFHVPNVLEMILVNDVLLFV